MEIDKEIKRILKKYLTISFNRVTNNDQKCLTLTNAVLKVPLLRNRNDHSWNFVLKFKEIIIINSIKV